tara:strand:- start:655 stop:1143 length:489 start_codon:yes stop_codon:yes gene_type:complete
MIITCINCDKKFNVNSELIPNEGRTIQCGSCNHVWFFKKNDQDRNNENFDKTLTIDKKISKTKNKPQSKIIEPLQEEDDEIVTNYVTNKKGSEIVSYKPKSNFTFVKLLYYILVIIISFVGLIIVLDTFKSPLYTLFPNLEFLLFSLYETLKDIELFIKDLF